MLPLVNQQGEHSPALTVFDHPGVALENKEATERIMRAVGRLPDNQQTALILKAIEGMPQQEIAEVMETSLKAVESLLSRAKKNLSTELAATKDLDSKHRLNE